MAEEAVWSPKGDEIALLDGESIKISPTEGGTVREIARLTPLRILWCGRQTANASALHRWNHHRARIPCGRSPSMALRFAGFCPRSSVGLTKVAEPGWPEGKYFAFSSGVDLRASLAVDARASLWLMQEQQGLFSRTSNPVQLTTGPIAFDHPVALTAAGRVFVIGSQSEYQLLRIDPETSTKTAMLTESGATDIDFSLDGQWVVYAARESGTLWKSRLDGTGKLELTAKATGAFAPTWSPDEKQILFTGFLLDKQPRLYVVSSKEAHRN